MGTRWWLGGARGWLGRGRRRMERGMVTAEIALGIPAVLMVLGLGATTLGQGVAQVRCAGVVGDLARQGARGDDLAAALARGRGAAPGGAVVDAARRGDVVVATCRPSVAGPLRAIGVTAVPVARATALVEEVGSDGVEP